MKKRKEYENMRSFIVPVQAYNHRHACFQSAQVSECVQAAVGWEGAQAGARVFGTGALGAMRREDCPLSGPPGFPWGEDDPEAVMPTYDDLAPPRSPGIETPRDGQRDKPRWSDIDVTWEPVSPPASQPPSGGKGDVRAQRAATSPQEAKSAAAGGRAGANGVAGPRPASSAVQSSIRHRGAPPSAPAAAGSGLLSVQSNLDIQTAVKVSLIDGQQPTKDDWRCPLCTRLVFGHRGRCDRCGIIRDTVDHAVCVQAVTGELTWEMQRRPAWLPVGEVPAATTRAPGHHAGGPADGTSEAETWQRQTVPPPVPKEPGTSNAGTQTTRGMRAMFERVAGRPKGAASTRATALGHPEVDARAEEHTKNHQEEQDDLERAQPSNRWKKKGHVGKPGRRRPRRRRRSCGGFNLYGGEGPGGRPLRTPYATPEWAEPTWFAPGGGCMLAVALLGLLMGVVSHCYITSVTAFDETPSASQTETEFEIDYSALSSNYDHSKSVVPEPANFWGPRPQEYYADTQTAFHEIQAYYRTPSQPPRPLEDGYEEEGSWISERPRRARGAQPKEAALPPLSLDLSLIWAMTGAVGLSVLLWVC